MQPQYKSMEEFLGNEPEEQVETPETPEVGKEENPAAVPAADTKVGEATEPKKTPEEIEEEAKKAKKSDATNPMKELRDKANAASKAQEKIDTAINRLSDGEYDFKLKDFKNEQGKVDYDALIKAMDEADVKKRAETRGLSPEMQAEIERYEKEKRQVEMEKARVQMDRQLNNFQMEQQLSSDDLNNFIADSMKLGINPLSIAALDKTAKGTTSLKMLYKAVYTDKIVQTAVDKAVEEARTKWEADLTAKGNQPKQNPANPNNTKTTKTDPKGMALDDFLKGLNT